MREYELIYVIQPDATDERRQQIHDRIDAAVTGGQGLILLRDDWGKRKLAYEIEKFQKGHYFQLNLLGDGKFIVEMERLMRIDPDVLRFLTVQANEDVADVEARIEEARVQAAEQEKRREERERLEAEREAEREKERARQEAVAQAREPEADSDDGAGRPAPEPATAPKPATEPEPATKPATAPEPAPEPATAPKPEPATAPAPEPEPEPKG